MIGGLIQVEEWEYEDLMYWLDGCNLAFIEFNDINVWLKEFDVDFGIQIKAFDQEDEFQRGQNISPAQYKLSPE